MEQNKFYMEHPTQTTPNSKKSELCYCRVHGTLGRSSNMSAHEPGMTQRNINIAFAHAQQQQNQQLFIHPESGKIFIQPVNTGTVAQQRHIHYAKHQRPYQNDFKSVPSSPVAQKHYQGKYNAAVLSAVAQANHAKKTNPHFYQPENPTTVVVGTPMSSEASVSGCCGGRDISLMKMKSRRGLSSSYSALDTVSTSESETSHGPPELNSNSNPKKVSECVKNLVSWVSKKGKESTTAIMDAMPSLKEDYHVVMVGLDSAGKSTLLYRLKFDQYVNTVPTIGFNCEKVRGSIGRSKNLTFLVWDVGGQEKIRPLWKPYTRGTDGVIFVIDSCDKERFEEAKLELHRIMRTPNNNATPLVVIANKQDLPEAKLPNDIESMLDLASLNNLWHLEPVCAVTGEGLDLAMEKLHELISKKRKLAKRARNKTR